MRHAWILLVALVFAFPSSAELNERRFSVTISGGISRGSYEAGLNWALVEAFRATQRKPFCLPNEECTKGAIDVVTGASAGTINTLLTVIEWCRANDVVLPPEKSAFWDAWITVGYGRLFPSAWPPDDSLPEPDCPTGTPDGPYCSDDGVFARAAFSDALQRVVSDLESAQFEPGCRISIGTTLTPTTPVRIDIFDQLSVDTQRVVVALDVVVNDDKRLVFTNRIADASRPSRLGPIWRLGGDDVTVNDLRDMGYASSAFPVAFGPRRVRGRLLPGGHGDSAWFIDGGVFDNTPLGLALDLAEDRTKLEPIFIETEKRRGLARPVARVDAAKNGLGGLVDLGANFVSVARAYEQMFIIRDRGSRENIREQVAGPPKQDAAKLLVSDRFAPIVGDTLLGFGAFLWKPFRIYDFGVGAYDALHGISRDICGENAPRACTFQVIRRLHAALELHGDVDYVLRASACDELTVEAIELPAADRAFFCEARIATTTPTLGPIVEAARALAREDREGARNPVLEENCPVAQRALGDRCRMSRFVDAMKAHGIEEAMGQTKTAVAWEQRELELARSFINDWDTWFKEQTWAVLARARKIEAQANDTSADERLLALTVGEAGLRTVERIRKPAPLSLDGTVPKEHLWWALLPNRAAFEVVNGSGELAWRGAASNFFLDVTPVRLTLGPLGTGPYDAAKWTRVFLRPSIAAGVRWKLTEIVEMEAMAGETWLPYASLECGVDGAEGKGSPWLCRSVLDVDLAVMIADKLRFSAGVREVSGFFLDVGRAPAFVFTIGLHDVAGLAYWANEAN